MKKNIIMDEASKKMEEGAGFFPKKLPCPALGLHGDIRSQEGYENIAESMKLSIEKDEFDYNIISNIIQRKTTFGGSKILTDNFYIMDVKYFNAEKNNKEFMIAELTILRFSFKHGIDNVYQEFLTNDGSTLKDSSRMIFRNQFGEVLPKVIQEPKNYAKVLSNIVGFLRKYISKTELMPPIYARNINTVTEFLNLLCYNCGENFTAFTVFKLEVLFLRMLIGLYERRGEELKFNDPRSKLFTLMLRNPFEYTEGLTCQYHKRSLECTQRNVKCWAYTIMSKCCPKIENLSMLPGKHVPFGYEIPYIKVDPLTATVFYKNADDGFEIHTYRLPKKNYAMMYLQIVAVMAELGAFKDCVKPTESE